MVVGMGTDIISVRRVGSLLERYGRRFEERWFSPGEIEYCRGKNDPAEHFAARLAAKEAAAKAVRIGKSDSLPWRDISVERDQDGVPALILEGPILERSRELGISAFHLSLSHCAEYATATVIAVGPGHDDGGSGSRWL